MIIIDNYDSFTYNIVQYIKALGIEPKVYLNDKVTIEELDKLDFSHILISPGPGIPDNAGISNEVIKHFAKQKIILGVCLGHQCIAQVYGCEIVKANEPVHGKVSKIMHNNDILFKDISTYFEATRYHSLVVDNESVKNSSIIPTAWCGDIIMALKHKEYSLYGVQFHPESILTKSGMQILKNFTEL